MKKILHLLIIVVLVALPMLVSAQATTTATSTATSTAVDAPSSQMKFIPLTNVPFIQEAGGAFNLTDFLNGLFKICIGVAAVVAVLQIMRAGIMYMGSDSGFAEKKEAKNLIALSIGGLILVLSPVVVFSVINPEILSLKIAGVEDLAVAEPDPLTPPGGTDDEGNPLGSFNGPYLFGRQYRTVEGANSMATFCNDQVIPESLKEIIKEYKTSDTRTAFGSDDQTRYAKYCESFSTRIWLYAPKGNRRDEAQRWPSPEMKSKYDSFKNGCTANGGRFVQDWDGLGKGFFGCGADRHEILRNLHPNTDPNEFECARGELECRAP